MPIKTHVDEQPTLNLVSMIDVLLMLIIFFMVGSKFTEEERKISLDLPKVHDAGKLTAAQDKRVVNVYSDGQLTLDGQSATLDELTARLATARGQSRDLGVTVRGDATVAFQRVADALNACRQAGISDLGISVQLGGRTVK